MKSAKVLLESAEPEEIEDKPKEITSQKGNIQLKDKKTLGAFRVLFETTQTSDRPMNVYRERITDADSGRVGSFIWWNTEDSQVLGRKTIVKINPRTEEERVIGYEYDIPYSEKVVASLKAKVFTKTKFYHKDGVARVSVPVEQF